MLVFNQDATLRAAGGNRSLILLKRINRQQHFPQAFILTAFRIQSNSVKSLEDLLKGSYCVPHKGQTFL